jgi:hypothetical protein
MNNLWNLNTNKTFFLIRERTEAQRRHLQSLAKTKSKLDIKPLIFKQNSMNLLHNKKSSLINI